MTANPNLPSAPGLGSGPARLAVLAIDPLVEASLRERVEGASSGAVDVVALARAEVVLLDLGPDPAIARERLRRVAELDLPTVALVPDATLGPIA